MLKYNKISSSGKGICLLFCFSFFGLHFAFGQGGTWTWISGDNATNSPGVYGTQGVPSINNHPPGLFESAEWKDKQGNFWIYGGWQNTNRYSDLWKYDPLTMEWTWIKGNGSAFQDTIYGTKGVPNAANTPGSRIRTCASWVDTSGSFWLFGGADGNYAYYNDLWKYDIATNNWTWISGSNSTYQNGVHGTQGIPSLSNIPGARVETSSAWTDSLNNLWLLGGYGIDDSNHVGYLNDLCKYDVTLNEWTWMKGSNQVDYLVNYGIRGVSSPSNDPGARETHTKWKDLSGNFWIMGGYGYTGSQDAFYNDVWRYEIHSNEWTWIAGPHIINDSGTYQHTCSLDTINTPYSRFQDRSAVIDDCGRFWLFGGDNSLSFLNLKNLNDLWIFDPQLAKWNWVSGTSVANQNGNYGTKGVPSSSNMPSSRYGGLAWWGNNNKLYIFGGSREGVLYCYSDLWVFEPDTNCVPSCNIYLNFQSGKTTLCANDCINFTDLSTNATSWQWSFAGGKPSSSTNQNPQICYLDSGIYNVTLVASNSAGSDTLSINNYITVNAAPATPVITQVHNDTLFCSTNAGYISYQWYLDSALVAGATDTFLVISKSGNYNVEVMNAAGCKTAVGINVVLGLQNYMSDHFVSLSPNPVGDKFTVYGLWFTIAGVEIYNVLGEETSPPTPLQEERGVRSIDVSGLASGIYFVQIIGEKERWVGRFVKE